MLDVNPNLSLHLTLFIPFSFDPVRYPGSKFSSIYLFVFSLILIFYFAQISIVKVTNTFILIPPIYNYITNSLLYHQFTAIPPLHSVFSEIILFCSEAPNSERI